MRNRIISVGVFLTGLTLLAQQMPQGQQAQSFKGVVRKGFAPVSNDVIRAKLPKAVDSKLSNGLTVMVIEDHRSPMVFLSLRIPASTLNDPAGLPGVASATADLLRRGTKTRTDREIVDTLAEIGATLNVYTGLGSTVTQVSASMLTENLDQVLEIFADVLLNPTFPQEELDKWKSLTLSNLQQMRAQPGFLANEMLQKVLYPNDPRSVVAPTPEGVKKITREDVVGYYTDYYKPSNSLIGVAGDISSKQITAKLEKLLAGWKTGTVKALQLPMDGPIAEKKVYLVQRPNSVQTLLYVGNRAIDRTSPDFFSCQVMNRILGSGPASRLFLNLREDKGYTYGIGSNFSASRFIHHFSASTSVRTEVTGAALEELLKEFGDIRDRPVPAAEMDDSRRALVAAWAIGLEQPSATLNGRMLAREYGFPDDYQDTYPDKLMKVTAEDVQRAAQKYIPLGNVQIVAVGDANKIRDVLKKFGPVEEYDSEGRKAAAASGGVQ
jgi:zinc protease